MKQITDLISKLNYDGGVLYWSERVGQRVFAGDVAGTKIDGYICIMYRKKYYRAHRIVWEMHMGKVPDGMEVDHINHIRDDNRIENLRIVTKECNMSNKSIYKNNSSGVTGVNQRKCGKWVAQIQSGGKKVGLYFGESFELAVKARLKAEIDMGFHINHGK